MEISILHFVFTDTSDKYMYVEQDLVVHIQVISITDGTWSVFTVQKQFNIPEL